MSEKKLVERTKASGLTYMLETLEFISDEPKEKEKEEEIVKETEPETQTMQLSTT